MPNNIITQPFILLAGATPLIPNDFAQYGFLGILLSILIYFSRNSLIEGRKNKAEDRKDRDELIKRYEDQLKELRDYNNMLVNKFLEILEKENKK